MKLDFRVRYDADVEKIRKVNYLLWILQLHSDYVRNSEVHLFVCQPISKHSMISGR
jgi:hypothetical protein